VVKTPHLGGSTIEAQVRVGVTIAEQVIDALSGRLPRFALNIPNQDPETISFVTPFLPLMEAMGSFYTQLFGMPTRGVEVRFGGQVGRFRTELLTAALLKGLLKPALGERVNMVNVGSLAESRGLEVTESRTSASPSFASLVTLTGRDDGRRTLSGTVLGEGGARIVEIDGFEVDVIPAGDVLVSWHSGTEVEQPGVVGRVGTMLGSTGVNICRMEVGREIIGERGIMVISPTGHAPREAAHKLASLPGVLEAHLVRLGDGLGHR
jgi:D-3-phosphoglycerate dehydrogenase